MNGTNLAKLKVSIHSDLRNMVMKSQIVIKSETKIANRNIESKHEMFMKRKEEEKDDQTISWDKSAAVQSCNIQFQYALSHSGLHVGSALFNNALCSLLMDNSC